MIKNNKLEGSRLYFFIFLLILISCGLLSYNRELVSENSYLKERNDRFYNMSIDAFKEGLSHGGCCDVSLCPNLREVIP